MLLSRLTCEVGLRNALDGFPEVRLPAPEMAKDYWQPEVRQARLAEGEPMGRQEGSEAAAEEGPWRADSVTD